MSHLSPILLFVYNRPQHTIETLNALKNNFLAKESDLYIFSDAPKDERQVKRVNEVRKIIENTEGFKSVNIIKAEQNKGLANSIIEGVTNIINHFGKVIVLEDDLVTSPTFLRYMNNALNLYSQDDRIWSISGYSPNFQISSTYKDDVYLAPRGSSWGWATWKDRWNLVDWDIKDYEEFKNNISSRKQFNKGGNDLAFMLDDQMAGRIDSWAIRWVYNQYKQSKYTIYPTKSLVKNIGLDFSGTHSSKTKKYHVDLYDGDIDFPSRLIIDKEILRDFKAFYDLNFTGYLGVLCRKFGIYHQVKKIRKIIGI